MDSVKGPFMMTYDQDSRVEAMAQERGFAVTRVAMKNTHHRQMVELLISKAAPSTCRGYPGEKTARIGSRVATF